MNDVTFVITSCGRMDLLDQTLKSLFDTDWDQFNCKILVEDSGDLKVKKYIESQYQGVFDLMLFNEKNIGKLKSIDKAYSYVKTKYIFHCEDDWFFYRKGFVVDSLKLLEDVETISMVSLRSFYWDYQKSNSQFGVNNRKLLGCVPYYYIDDKSDENPMNGFSLNPGLRRVSDLNRLGSLSEIGAEYLLSKYFLNIGKKMVVLENGAIEHIGWGRGLEDPGKQPLFYKKIKNLIKALLNVFGGKYYLHN